MDNNRKEELLNELRTWEDKQIAVSQVAQSQGIGGQTALERRRRADELSSAGVAEVFTAAFKQDNVTVAAINGTHRALSHAIDPKFDVSQRPDITDSVPFEYRTAFAGAVSEAHALAIRQEINDDFYRAELLEHAGFGGLVARGLAMILDPVSWVSLGAAKYATLASAVSKYSLKAGIKNSTALATIQGAARGAVDGTVAGVGVGVVDVTSRPTGQWEDLPVYGLMGLGFGATIGAGVSRQQAIKFNQRIEEAIGEFKTAFDAEIAGVDPRGSARKSEFNSHMDAPEADGSVGAARIPDEPLDFDTTGMNKETIDLIKKARRANRWSPTPREQFDTSTPLGKAAYAFYNALDKTPLRTDYDTIMNSNSDLAKYIGHALLESAAGFGNTHKTGALLQDFYRGQIAAPVTGNYPEAFSAFVLNKMKAEGKSPNKYKVFDVERAALNPYYRDGFNSAVIEELMHRRFSGTGMPNQDPIITEFVNKIDEASARAVKIQRGTDGETSVFGAEELEESIGWFRQLWDGGKMLKYNKSIPQFNKKLEDTLFKQYMELHPHLGEKYNRRYAKAVINRAYSNETQLDTNLYRLLSQEGTEYAARYLEAGGFGSAEEIADFIAKLRASGAENSKLGHLKKRMEIDMRTPIEGTNLRLMDVMDIDIPSVWMRYSRQAAGASAMARHGIHKKDLSMLKGAILEEQAAKGGGKLTPELLDGIFSHFSGGPIAGGVDPYVRMATQLANLSLLNGLGLTSMAELGVAAAASGFARFVDSMPKEARDMLKGEKSDIMAELAPFMHQIDGEHKLFQDHIMFDEVNNSQGYWPEVNAFMEKFLSAGRKWQGYLSGANAVKQLNQRVAIRSMVNKLAMDFKSGKADSARIRDIFREDGIPERIKRYFTDERVEYKGEVEVTPAVVEFNSDGTIKSFNWDKWDPEDQLDFIVGLHRHTNQVVQRALAGEDNIWFHKGMGVILTHLKTFPLVAMQKQALRNARIADPEAFAAVTYSMMFASTVFMMQQIVAGRDENLTPDKIVRGGFGLSNITGFIPMFVDPVATMLSLEDYRLSPWDSPAAGGSVLGTPPVLSVGDKLLKLPGAVGGIVSGNGTAQDAYTLKAIPLIGNLYPFTFAFNHLAEDLKESRAEDRKEARKQAREENKIMTEEEAKAEADKLLK